MKSQMRAAAVAAASLAAFGCAGATQSARVAGPAAGQGCAARVASADVSGWRSVEADGFTFCVPPDWNASGRSWSRGNAKVTWGVGQTVPQADVPAMARASTRPMPECVAPSDKHVQIRPTSEVIDGREAQVWRTRFPRGFYTGGHWESPHFYIVGEASDPATADLEMTIVRTARIASR